MHAQKERERESEKKTRSSKSIKIVSLPKKKLVIPKINPKKTCVKQTKRWHEPNEILI